MSASGCIPTTMCVTELLSMPEVQESWLRLRDAHAPAAEFVTAMCSFAPADIAATMLDEFQVLPSVTVTSLVDAWALAHASRKHFEFVSLKPEEPLAFARHRRVRLTVEVDEDRVTLFLSHIPTRHAEWYGLSRSPAVANAR